MIFCFTKPMDFTEIELLQSYQSIRTIIYVLTFILVVIFVPVIPMALVVEIFLSRIEVKPKTIGKNIDGRDSNNIV